MDTGPANLWERQPGESPRAFCAFCHYRDQGAGKRSLDEVCRRLYGPQTGRKRAATGRVQEWSRVHRWVQRASAWDDHLDLQAQATQVMGQPPRQRPRGRSSTR